MRLLLLVVAALASVVAGSTNALSIHVFNVGQADSQLIVFPSGYTILIDVGELGPRLSTNSQYVAAQIKNITGGSYIDVGVVTHLHLDHVGQAKYGGFWALAEKYGITFGKLLDRDAGTWVDSNSNNKCEYPGEIVWKYIGSGPPDSTTSEVWVCYATNSSSKIGKVREIAQVCSETQISPSDSGATVRIVSGDAYNAYFYNSTSGIPVAANYFNQTMPPYENDYSIGVILNYGGFTYATFGDLDGAYSASTYNGYWYNDIETTVLGRIGPVDVYHVNHHGSSMSTNAAFLKKMSPTVGVISCGANNSYNHPSSSTLTRLSSANVSVFITNQGVSGKDYSPAVVASSDITITVVPNSGQFTVTTASTSKVFSTKGASSLPSGCNSSATADTSSSVVTATIVSSSATGSPTTGGEKVSTSSSSVVSLLLMIVLAALAI